MTPLLRGMLNAAMAVALTVLLGIGWVSVRAVQQTMEADRWTTHTYMVINQLDRFLSALKDAETGQRGFLLTGEAAYLEPYNAAVNEVRRYLGALISLTSDNPRQLQRLGVIKSLTEARLAVIARSLHLRRDAGFKPALELMQSGQGKKLMDAIRREVAQARSEEQLLLKHRLDDKRANAGTTLKILVAGWLLSFLILLSVLFFLKRENLRRLQSEAELRVNRDRLQELVRKLEAEAEERGVAQALLEMVNAQLEGSNRGLESIATVTSHDLQEPLRTVVLYTELLADRYQGKLDEKADEYIHFIVGGAAQMKLVINDFYEFARLEGTTLPFSPVKMESVLEQALGSLQAPMRAAEATVERAEMPELAGDERQLTLLFRHLLENAVNFRKKDAPLTIRVTAERNGGIWLFGVHDNGIGIEPRFFERIFGVFQRLHPREQYGGSGIGLAICRKIVERHGGRIWVESEIGAGSSFYFTLPMRGEAHGRRQSERPDQNPAR